MTGSPLAVLSRDGRLLFATRMARTFGYGAVSFADLQSLFPAAEPATQHRIVQALFEQVEVLGPTQVWLYPSLEGEARGWAAAMRGEFRVEVRKTGRGER
jgi:hypothetical protein